MRKVEREGRANTARGAAHFLRETVGRVRHAGAGGQLTMRADSGFYTYAVVAVCRKTDVRYSITVRQHASLRNLIEAIPEADWAPIPLYLTLAMEPSAADRHPLGHDRPSSSEGRRAPYQQSPNSCLGQSSPYRTRTGQRSRRRYRWKRTRDT